MKAIIYISILVGGISLILGLISRFTMVPLNVARGGVEAEAFLAFTNTCLLIAITFILLEIVKNK